MPKKRERFFNPWRTFISTFKHTHTDSLTISLSSSSAGASIGNRTKAFDNPDNHTLSERKRLKSAGTVGHLRNLYLQHYIDREADD